MNREERKAVEAIQTSLMVPQRKTRKGAGVQRTLSGWVE